MAEMFSHTLKLFLLLTIVHFKFGTGLLVCWRCDPCPEPHDNTSSLVSAVTCTSSQTACVKNTIRVLNQAPQISKGCTESCTPSSSNFFGQGSFVDCCYTNYCNLSTRNRLSSSVYLPLIVLFFYSLSILGH